MKLTIKHYIYYSQAKKINYNLASMNSWDTLRLDDNDDWHSVPRDRKVWIDRCLKKPEIVAQGKAIAKLCRDKAFKSVKSVGCGCAYMEYNLKQEAPEIKLTCSDYTPKSMDRLREVFSDCESIETFDIFNSKWKPSNDTLHVLYRVDTEFTDEQWKQVFARMGEAGVVNILFIPSVFLSPRSFLIEKLVNLLYRITGRKVSFAGYVRTKDTVKSFWVPHYSLNEEVPVENLTGFLLRKI